MSRGAWLEQQRRLSQRDEYLFDVTRRAHGASRLPSGLGLRSKTAVRRFAEDESYFDEDDWNCYRVPRSRRPVFLPGVYDDLWESVVGTIAAAQGSSGTSGPWTRERRQEICRAGKVYFILCDEDGEYEIDIIGEFDDAEAGVAAALERATAFVPGRDKSPVSWWVDIDGDDGDTSCLSDDSWSAEAEDKDEDEEDDDDVRARHAWERLWNTSITRRDGLVLAGGGAVSALPSERSWFVLPVYPDLERGLMRHVPGSFLSFITTGTEHRSAVATDGLSGISATSLAEEVGIGVVFELTVNEVRALTPDGHDWHIEATALRDRPGE
ncbi:MAG: hypothetical protein ABIQ39_02495 [Ilumatobacteraceae bacterium]